MFCAQPLGTSSNVASHRHSAYKTEEFQPCDFQVTLTCSKYLDFFLSCGLNVDATKNYQWTRHLAYDSQIAK